MISRRNVIRGLVSLPFVGMIPSLKTEDVVGVDNGSSFQSKHYIFTRNMDLSGNKSVRFKYTKGIVWHPIVDSYSIPSFENEETLLVPVFKSREGRSLSDELSQLEEAVSEDVIYFNCVIDNKNDLLAMVATAHPLELITEGKEQ